MSYHSAYDVGDTHRFLTQPRKDTPEGRDKLREDLKRSNSEALAYVCIDLGRLPAGKFSKKTLLDELVTWVHLSLMGMSYISNDKNLQRMSMPTEELKRAPVNSSLLLRYIQRAVREIITPTWVGNPPSDVGLKSAGTLKMSQWRTLFEIHVPLVMLSLWKAGSPLAGNDTAEMAPVLETSMHLTCAARLMVKRTLTSDRRRQFHQHIVAHINGLKRDFPGYIYPSHHQLLHLSEFTEEFSGVRHWWVFPFENLIGKLQGILSNHKPGMWLAD